MCGSVVKGELGASLGVRAIQGLGALWSPFAFDYLDVWCICKKF